MVRFEDNFEYQACQTDDRREERNRRFDKLKKKRIFIYHAGVIERITCEKDMLSKRKAGRKTKTMNVVNWKRKTLSREIELSALNTDRYRRLWQEMLMRVKMPEINRKVEVTWQTLEHVLDLKDYRISILLDSLQEAEDQRRKANGDHAETIHRSLKAQEKRLQVVDTLFYQNTRTAFVDATHDFGNINYYRNKDETVLRKVNVRVNRRNEDILNIVKSSNISEVDAFREDGKNERRVAVAQLQKLLEDLWIKLRSVLSFYRSSTEGRRIVYDTIRKKDEFDTQSINRQYLRITNLLNEISQFREQMHSYRVYATNELHGVTQELHFFNSMYHEANETFVLGRKQDKLKTTTMSIEYNRSLKRLKKLIVKAERIFTYMQLCRKYETQNEKIVSTIVDRAVIHPLSAAQRNDTFSSINLMLHDFQHLISFWHRLGRAQVIIAQLRAERDRLLAQRERLQMFIKRCLASKLSIAETTE